MLKAKGGGRVTFRDLLGLHDVWKGYAARLVSQCGSNERLVQQRVLAADLQVGALLRWLTVSMPFSCLGFTLIRAFPEKATLWFEVYSPLTS